MLPLVNVRSLLAAALAVLVVAPASAHAVADPSSPTVRNRVATGDYPITIATSPDARNAYVTNYYDDTVTMYDRRDEGDLVAIGTVAAGDVPWHAVVSPDGRSVYVTNYGGNSISVYARDTTTGVLTPRPAATIATGLDKPTTLVVSADGANAYVVNEGSSDLVAFTRDAATGALTELEVHTASDVSMGLAISPDGKFIYLGDCDGTAISIYSRDPSTGRLSPPLVPALDVIHEPRSLTMSPDGKQLYAANEAADTIGVYVRNITDGSLVEGPAVAGIPGGGSPRHVALTSSGSHAYVALRGVAKVGVFTRTAATGALTHVRDIATGDRPTSVAVGADVTLYTADSNDDRISAFDIGTPPVDLSIAATAPAVAMVGDTAKFNVVVKNEERQLKSASGTVTVTLPSELEFLSAMSSSGCSIGGRIVTCAAGALDAGASAQLVVAVKAAASGARTLTFAVRGSVEDTKAANDTAAATTRFDAPAMPTANVCPTGTSAGVRCVAAPNGGLVITGTRGNDTIIGSGKADVIRAGAGNDRIVARGGNDLVHAGDGNDVIIAGSGNDRVYGQAGNDRIVGGTGRDLLIGGGGNDHLVSVDGGTRDMLNGGYGDDVAVHDAADRLRFVQIMRLAA